jgi:hypothetical protein
MAMKMKWRVTYLLFCLTLCLSLTLVGCVTERGDEYTPLWSDVTTVDKYIGVYGTEYKKEQKIEGNTIYQYFTWPVHGVKVKTVLETGEVVNETTSDPNSQTIW